MYCHLYLRVEILYAQADAIEADFTQNGQRMFAQLTRIDFYGILSAVIFVQVEVLTQHAHQFAHLLFAEKGRCTTPPVQLLHAPFGIHQRRLQTDLAVQAVQIGLRPAAIGGDNLVAGAVIANMGAERDMHIQGQRPPAAVAFLYPGNVILLAHLGRKLHRRGIGGIARPATGVAPDQVSIKLNGIRHT